MRIGLASYVCKNRNISFNMTQMEKAMRESQGKVDLLCFGEAYLQGFDSLFWDYAVDNEVLSLKMAKFCIITEGLQKVGKITGKQMSTTKRGIKQKNLPFIIIKLDLPYAEICGIVRRSSKQNIC